MKHFSIRKNLFHVKHFTKKEGKSLKKRLTALFIVIIMILSVIGCENVKYPSEESGSENFVSDYYGRLDNDLPDLNGEGEELIERTFEIVTDDESVFIQDESKAGTINDAIKRRDNFLRQKYGANVKVRAVKSKDVAEEITKSLATGTNYCDMLAVSAKDTVSLYLDGLLADMNTFDGFDPQGEYFDQKNATNLATNSSFYILADPTTRYFNEIYTMFFNRDLVLSSGAENPESLAAQGLWTWDKFSEIEKTVAMEVVNKTVANLNSDVFGFSAYYGSNNYANVMYVSCGAPFIENTYYNPVDFSPEVESAVNIGRYLYKVNDSKARYPFEGDDSAKAFTGGRLAFFTNKLSFMSRLRSGGKKGSEYGFVPMPKYNEQQEEYYSLVDPAARVICVPKTVESQDFSYKRFVGAVISGMCAVSGKTVKEAFISDTIVRYLNDNTEASMLKLVTDSAYFDFSTVYGSKISAIHNSTVNSICEYIDVGSDMYNTIMRNIDGLRDYANGKFQ